MSIADGPPRAGGTLRHSHPSGAVASLRGRPARDVNGCLTSVGAGCRTRAAYAAREWHHGIRAVQGNRNIDRPNDRAPLGMGPPVDRIGTEAL